MLKNKKIIIYLLILILAILLYFIDIKKSNKATSIEPRIEESLEYKIRKYNKTNLDNEPKNEPPTNTQ